MATMDGVDGLRKWREYNTCTKRSNYDLSAHYLTDTHTLTSWTRRYAIRKSQDQAYEVLEAP